MRPLYKKSVIVGIRMAREIQIVFFVLFILLSFSIEVYFAKEKCVVCSKDVKGQGGSPVSGYQADFEACFGIEVFTAGGKICATCRKAVTDYRNNGKDIFPCKFDILRLNLFISK